MEDFTTEINETEVQEQNPRVQELKQEIQKLESMLKFPAAFRSAIVTGVIGYLFAKKTFQNGMIGGLAGAFAGYKLGQKKELTIQEKRSINDQIQIRIQELKKLGIEIQGDETGLLSAGDLENLDYPKFDFDDPYLEFIGRPAVGFHAIVFGLPKSGKSIWSLKFADYLANDFGRVLYVASEEGFKGTIKDKVSQFTTNRDDLIFGNFKGIDKIRENISGFDFVFIDSLDYAKITVEEVEELKRENPDVSFITVKQVTKDGKFRGSQEFAHNCDILVEIEKGIATQRGRFNPESEMQVF